uniref:Putative secreted protein n=1 Tax=Anopheles marajoara TaxID=58244 RepID=A0A2M4CDX5_9DIPT
MIVVVYQRFVVLFRWIRRLSSFRVDVLGHLHFRFGSGSRDTLQASACAQSSHDALPLTQSPKRVHFLPPPL